MIDYEKLGQFYLGKEFDLSSGQAREDVVLYDAKDLTTHAVIVGMTGSGKTGLGITLLEEAAIDGIPALIIDPKGDMGNLLLSFPQLRPEDFRPWVHADDAARKGLSIDEYAADRADLWRKGLADWDQKPQRIGMYREAAEAVIYTPGSDAGLPLTVLRSLDVPSPAVLASTDAMRERISAAASGLLTLLGINADPIRSREHILVSNILDQSWRAGRSLDMAALIYEIQSPSFKKIGIMDVDQIFPPADRMSLAMTLNNVLASPSFAGWMQGESLDIQRLLYTPEGQPRLCVLSIAHLSDQERMFFVTILLNEVISWMRSQPGTSSLRALLYMDEVFGYLPPTANPPSKTPLLTLLKQARAYGLGLVLATQNPVDLDYKALSNAGTWFLGRLQTERDKLRLLDGLEGASTTAGTRFNRAELEKTLSSLGQRVFLQNNIHEDRPVLFQSRWALSYLSGPMTREQIATLMRDRKPAANLSPADPRPAASAGLTAAIAPVAAVQTAAPTSADLSSRPLLHDSIDQRFAAISRSVPREARILYRPALLGLGKLHYIDSKTGIDLWQGVQRVCRIEDDVPAAPWDEADNLDRHPLGLDKSPAPDTGWAELPSELVKAAAYKSWASRFKDYLYRNARLELYHCVELGRFSQPGQSEGDFRVELKQFAREQRDLEIAKLRAKIGERLARQTEAIRTAERRVEVEEQQAKDAQTSAWVSTGTSILGALFGRKKVSVTNIGRAGSAARAHSRASTQKGDISRAQAKLDDQITAKEGLEADLQRQIDALSERYDVESLTIEPREIPPRKSDITITLVGLLWQPWRVDANGLAEPAWDQAAE